MYIHSPLFRLKPHPPPTYGITIFVSYFLTAHYYHIRILLCDRTLLPYSYPTLSLHIITTFVSYFVTAHYYHIRLRILSVMNSQHVNYLETYTFKI